MVERQGPMAGRASSSTPDETPAGAVPSQWPVYGGRYAVEAELGRGGMGRVLRARDLKLGRAIALKVLVPGKHDEQQQVRFEQEARAAGALDHPNIVAVHDVGGHGDEAYIVTELLEGETLRLVMKNGPLAPEKVLDLGTQLADGLAAAHRKGIIHRDLKPENLFLTEEGRLKILDFGIAKLLPEATDGPARFSTDTGAVIGTPVYMSPEQIRGHSADARSDVFACGAILHEMLSGSPPFARTTTLETAYAILRDSPAARPNGPLSRIAGRCLEKEPAARYANAGELLDDFHALAKGARITAGMAGRRRVTVIVAVVLMSALALALLARRYIRERQGAARIKIAVADFTNETDDKDLSGLSGMLITSLEQSKRLHVLTRGAMYETLKQMGKTDVQRIDEPLARELARQVPLDALVLASIRRFGEVYAIDVKVLDPSKNEYRLAAKDQGRGKEGVPGMIDQVSEHVRIGLGETPPDLKAASVPVARSTTANLEAYRHLFRGEQLVLRDLDPDVARQEFRQAIALDPDFALAHLRLFQLGGVESELDLTRALTLADRLSEKDRCSARAGLSLVQGRQAEAVALQKDCADRFPDDEWIGGVAADWSYHTGDVETAAAYLEKRLTVNPVFTEGFYELMVAWQLRGRFDRMLALTKESVRKHHTPVAYGYLVWAFLAAGNGSAAEETVQEMERRFPGDWTAVRIRLGVHAHACEPEKAEALLDRPEWATVDPTLRLFQVRKLHLLRGRFRKAIALTEEHVAKSLQKGDKIAAARSVAYKGQMLFLRGDFAESRRATAEAAELAFGGQSVAAARLTSGWQAQLGAALMLIPLGQFLLDSYRVLGNGDAASDLIQSRLAAPWSAEWHIAAARARQRGRLDDEISAYENLVAGDPDFVRARLVDLGALYLRADQPRKAIEALNKTLVGPPFGFSSNISGIPNTFVHGWYRLGTAHERVGDTAAALQAYRRVLRMWSDADPDLPELIDTRLRVAALEKAR